MLNFCDFIQVCVFSTNHHLKAKICGVLYKQSSSIAVDETSTLKGIVSQTD